MQLQGANSFLKVSQFTKELIKRFVFTFGVRLTFF